MSKIKDLLAEQENIDDLKPLSPYDAVMWNIKQDLDDIIKEFRERAEFTAGTNDDGYEEVYFENFCDLCEEVAGEYLSEYALTHRAEMHKLNGVEYNLLRDKLRDNLADLLADIESEIINDAEENSKERYDKQQDKYY